MCFLWGYIVVNLGCWVGRGCVGLGWLFGYIRKNGIFISCWLRGKFLYGLVNGFNSCYVFISSWSLVGDKLNK